MKNLNPIVLTLALLPVLVSLAQANTAELQVVHNAADPAAEVVDVYVNDGLLLDDFAFRTATPFVEVPAGVNLNIGVAPGNSSGPEDVLADFDVTLEAHERYVVFANGVLDPTMFAPNPNGLDIGFTLFAEDGIKERAYWGFVKVKAFHGVTDAPAVDIRAQTPWGSLPLFTHLAYGDYSGYLPLFASEFVLDVTPAGDPETVVASFSADLSSLRNEAIVVYASGFLDPAANQGGAGFGLLAVLADGTVVELPAISAPTTASIQIIHNAADPAASVVDIYVNDELLLDNFAFRAATPFVDVPAGVNLNIGVAPGTSGGPEDILADFDVTLTAGETYVAVANGVLMPGEFAPNPDGADIAFTLFARDGIRTSGNFGLVKLIALHGATDAPAVDIRKRTWWGGSKKIIGDLAYGEFSRYRTLRPRIHVLDITPAGQPETVVASFEADLRGLGNGAAVVFASGFLDPGANQGGAAFGLLAALPDGTVIALPGVEGKDLLLHEKEGERPAEARYELSQNFPNPFNPMTTIAFSLPRSSNVTLRVYNTRGQLVRTLLQEPREAGSHQVTFDATDLASGMYFYRIDAEGYSATKNMMLVK